MVEMDRVKVETDGRSEDSFYGLVQAAPDAVLVLDPNLVVSYANLAVERTLGYPVRDFVGTALPAYLHVDEREQARIVLQDVAEHRTPLDLRARHADGSWRLFEMSPVDLPDDIGGGGLVVYLRDVTAERELRKGLAHRALHDHLTSLPNRALFMNRLDHALASAARRQGPVTVLFVDLDDLKSINDGLGHEVGDVVLTMVGQRLQSCLRPGDTVARFGGDEYAVLLEHEYGSIDVNRIMRRITRAIREPVAVEDHRLFVTASIGAATGMPGRDLARDLLRRADLNMYRTKREGKDGFWFLEGESPDAARRGPCFERRLKAALDNGELRLHYQPRVALGTGEILGMEALLRWDRPRHGSIPSQEIIALAEADGLMGQLGRWILEEACTQGLRWQDRYPDAPPLVSVNLSSGQLCQSALADEVAGALSKTGLHPHNLALETEEAFPVDAPHVVSSVEKLGDLGVNFIIDEFGTESSSLYSAGRFPVGMLKIDQRLVERLGSGERDTYRLVCAMVEFARALGLRSVAEGVETAPQSTMLRRMGCEMAQGYYFWRPLPGEEATRLLDRKKGHVHRTARGADTDREP